MNRSSTTTAIEPQASTPATVPRASFDWKPVVLLLVLIAAALPAIGVVYPCDGNAIGAAQRVEAGLAHAQRPEHAALEEGVHRLARGRLDQAMWLFAEVDLERAAEVRAYGQVLNHRDWPEQEAAGVTLPAVALA